MEITRHNYEDAEDNALAENKRIEQVKTHAAIDMQETAAEGLGMITESAFIRMKELSSDKKDAITAALHDWVKDLHTYVTDAIDDAYSELVKEQDEILERCQEIAAQEQDAENASYMRAKL